jgi:hypothetical protein
MKVASAQRVAGADLVLAAAGCADSSGGDKGVASADRSGGATAGSGNGASAAPSLSRQDNAIKFARCMREQGIPMDDPDANGGNITIGGRGIDRAKMQAASSAGR